VPWVFGGHPADSSEGGRRVPTKHWRVRRSSASLGLRVNGRGSWRDGSGVPDLLSPTSRLSSDSSIGRRPPSSPRTAPSPPTRPCWMWPTSPVSPIATPPGARWSGCRGPRGLINWRRHRWSRPGGSGGASAVGVPEAQTLVGQGVAAPRGHGWHAGAGMPRGGLEPPTSGL